MAVVALIESYELLMRQVRWVASPQSKSAAVPARPGHREVAVAPLPAASPKRSASGELGVDARRQAWQWAQANLSEDGSLPSGKVIGDRYGRHERWGRLVKAAGTAGEFG